MNPSIERSNQIKKIIITLSDSLITSRYTSDKNSKTTAYIYDESRVGCVFHEKVAYFNCLLECYRITKQKTFLSSIESQLDSLLCFFNQHLMHNYSIGGKMGLTILFVRYEEITGKRNYRDTVLKIANDSNPNYLESDNVDDSFENGRAGTLYALFLIYQHYQSEQILILINLYLKRILSKIRFTKPGSRHDFENGSILGLTDVSLGNACLFNLFFQIGRILNNDSFLKITDAFVSEYSYFRLWNERTAVEELESPSKLSCGIFPEIFSYSFLNNTMQDSALLKFILKWFQTLLLELRSNSTIFHSDTEQARLFEVVSGISKELSTSRSLIKIIFGMWLIELYKIFRNITYLKIADRISFAVFESALSQSDMEANEIILRTHLALQLLEPDKSISVIFFSLNETPILSKSAISSYPMLNMTERKLDKLFMQNVFPRTIFLLESVACDSYNIFFDTHPSSFIKLRQSFINFVESIISEISEKDQDVLKEIFHLEKLKLNLLLNVKSYRELSHEFDMNQELLQEFMIKKLEKIFGCFLETNKDLIVIKSQYDFRVNTRNEYSKSNPCKVSKSYALRSFPRQVSRRNRLYNYLYDDEYRHSSVIMELELSQSEQLLLEIFETRRKVADAIDIYFSNPGISLNAQNPFQQIIYGEIRRLIFYGLLVAGA